jgi:hypothetical protein
VAIDATQRDLSLSASGAAVNAEIDTPALLYDVLMTPLGGLVVLGLILLFLAVVFVFRRSAYRKALRGVGPVEPA